MRSVPTCAPVEKGENQQKPKKETRDDPRRRFGPACGTAEGGYVGGRSHHRSIVPSVTDEGGDMQENASEKRSRLSTGAGKDRPGR